MMSDVVSSNSKNANNFNDLKKEYLKIQEEISEAKKSLNKINLILGELERSLKIKEFSSLVDVPVIAGGLIETEEEMRAALEAGASVVSTGETGLWSIKL